MSSPEQSVHSQFIDSISFKHGRYEIHLPWRYVRKRLMSLLNRLRQEPQVLLEYDAMIRDQIERGIVEKVSEPASGEVGRVHYLPHHTAIRTDNKTQNCL